MDFGSAFALSVLAAGAAAQSSDGIFVSNGEARDVEYVGSPWRQRAQSLQGSRLGSVLYAGKRIGRGDFHVRAQLSIDELDGTGASFSIDSHSQFGFDGAGRRMFGQGPVFGSARARFVGSGTAPIEPGSPFEFEVVRRGDRLRFLIDGAVVATRGFAQSDFGRVGFRSHRGTINLLEFSVEGELRDTLHRPAEVRHQDVFVGGRGGYHTYRAPVLVVTSRGTLLAFAEGRGDTHGDSGDVDVVMRRSTDRGATWSRTEIIWSDGANTCGNPCAVVERETGSIFVLMTHNRGGSHTEEDIVAGRGAGARTVWITRSRNDGQSWSAPGEITDTTKEPSWTWYATGPGIGIQVQRGAHAGRLVVPCDHIESGSDRYYSHVIYSDDQGASWEVGGSTPKGDVSECQVAELGDGRLMLNGRNLDRSKRARAVCQSSDGGLTWTRMRLVDELPEPICQAGFLRYPFGTRGQSAVLMFSNPANVVGRVRMAVRISEDDGASWSDPRILHAGRAAYSCLAVLGEDDIACLYERGDFSPYERIALARFSLDWLRSD